MSKLRSRNNSLPIATCYQNVEFSLVTSSEGGEGANTLAIKILPSC